MSPPRRGRRRWRRGGNPGFAPHLLRFQHPREAVTLVDAIAHDGRCAYRLRAGLYRPVCSNGLLLQLGDFGLIHLPHRGDVVRNVVAAALAMTRDFSQVGEVVERMHRTPLTAEQQVRFARQAMSIRYGQRHWPIMADMVLSPRRLADEGNDLWRIYNVVQYNLVHGGIRGLSASGRATRSRPVQAIREDVRINLELWQLALSMIRRKSPAVGRTQAYARQHWPPSAASRAGMGPNRTVRRPHRRWRINGSTAGTTQKRTASGRRRRIRGQPRHRSRRVNQGNSRHTELQQRGEFRLLFLIMRPAK